MQQEWKQIIITKQTYDRLNRIRPNSPKSSFNNIINSLLNKRDTETSFKTLLKDLLTKL